MKKRFVRRNRSRSFTLIESLALILAITLILAGIVLFFLARR